ncbi:DgyrCDS6827 [Dimorphilus gyrociliatus]|uniref:DgyrCDS6827 n=1 Tax=Dimorphilus gyrociliatus TaxID=2664684 RepID=A0A7I8VP71_9ANNE|nr:DgyrCDS6827 [Dimorphilus gyrociliatus]
MYGAATSVHLDMLRISPPTYRRNSTAYSHRKSYDFSSRRNSAMPSRKSSSATAVSSRFAVQATSLKEEEDEEEVEFVHAELVENIKKRVPCGKCVVDRMLLCICPQRHRGDFRAFTSP